MESTALRLSIAVTTFGVVLLALCVCFDRFNRKDFNYRKKMRQKRDKKLLDKFSMEEILPEINDPRDQQALILHEIHIAETLMTDGKFERAIVHFANAIAICADPHKLVLALKETLPPSAFDMLLKVLAKSYGKRFSRLPDGRICLVQHHQQQNRTTYY